MKVRKDKIIILGGGGHAKVLIELIIALGQYEVIGILDQRFEVGTKILDVPVLGKDEIIPALYKKGIKNACIGIAGTKNNINRRRLYEKVKANGFFVPALNHPNSIISDNAKFSEGVQVMAGAMIQTQSLIGKNTIINTGAIIEHDCNIGKYVHICPGAVICGGGTVDEGAFVGAGSTVIQGIKIGKDTTIAAGSVVVNDVTDGTMVKGIPAR